MGKTTNILDLNNRLTKVEKENVSQNNYNSLQNRPKINGNLLTGNKTGAQLGLAEAQDIGDLSVLTTTDKSSCVGAINELNAYHNRIYGALIDITAYDSASNYYEVPNDGMVILAVNEIATNAKLSLMDKTLNATIGESIGNGVNQMRANIAVIKGQRLYSIKTNAIGAVVLYFPKVNPS